MALVEIDGIRLDFAEYVGVPRGTRFEDVSGKSGIIRGSRFLWDPDFHKDFGLTNLKEVWLWVKANINRLEGDGFKVYYCEEYFGYNVSLRTLRDHTIDIPLDLVMSADCEEISPVRALPYSDKTADGPESFILFSENQEEDKDKKYTIKSFTTYGQIFYSVKTVRKSTQSHPPVWYKLKNYSYKTEPTDTNWWRTVHKESSAWFGLELEVSTDLSPLEIQTIVTEMEPQQEPFFIFKEDSSISGRYDHALEFVTVPCSPKYLRRNFKIFFEKLEKLAKEKGKTIGDYFDTSEGLSNGIHIHVDRDCFSDVLATRRFVASWQTRNSASQRLLDSVAKRPNGLKSSSYSSFSESYKGRNLASKLNPRRPIPTDRTSVVNERNTDTLEVRAYQGIFNLRHIIQCISFTEAMVEMAHSCGYQDFGRRFVPKIATIINKSKKYSSLKEYVKCA